ncbi:MAG: hypothetical protein V1495_09270, partial [Pseudomonadota bacterium]
TEETKRIPTSALTVILAVYAGIDSVFGLSQEYIEDAYDYVTEYRRNNPYFNKCYKEAYGRAVVMNKRLFNKDVEKIFPPDDKNFDPLNLLASFTDDAWDRSGKIHQVFRMAYFNALYKTDQFLNEENLETFGRYQEATDWSAMDRLFQRVINERYGLPTYTF